MRTTPVCPQMLGAASFAAGAVARSRAKASMCVGSPRGRDDVKLSTALAAPAHSCDRRHMIPIDFKGKTAFVTGVADDVGFGWHIATALQAAGADVNLGCHPRVVGIVEKFMTRTQSAESRKLPHGVPGDFKPKAIL